MSDRDAKLTTAGPSDQVDPFTLGPNQCPWDRYHRDDRRSRLTPFGPDLVVHDAADVRDILTDRRFVQGMGTAIGRNDRLDPKFVRRRLQSIVLREDPDHVRLRRLAAPAFTPRAVARHRGHLNELMNRLADAVPADGVCDAVATLTHAYPVLAICRVLGMAPDNFERFSELVDTIFNAQSGVPGFADRGLAAHDELDDHIRATVEHRRAVPGDDLITDLVRAQEDDDRLTSDELTHLVSSMIMAGTDTTRNQLALGLHLFADHPDQWTALGDGPAAVATAVEEIMRFAPIGQALLRVASEDVPWRDITIPAGTLVVLYLGAANRDPTLSEDAERFDIRRATTPPHLTFGHGNRFCLGAALARAELTEAVTVLRARFPGIAHAGPASWRRVGFVQGPTVLPLRFTRAR